jgi:RNA polymerase sigma-70 factor (ECF subfamily)
MPLMAKDSEKLFLTVYEEYADPIFRFCVFKCADRDYAKDLTQEVFLKLWKYIEDGNEVKNFKSLLYKIALNLIIDNSRKKKAISLDNLMEVNPQYEPSDPDQKGNEQLFLEKQVTEAIYNLDEDEKELLTMRYIEGLTPKEIAEVKGTNANNISVKINNAKKSLQEVFTKGKN